MKIRIHNNSIRLRLSQNALEELKNNGYFEQKVDFGTEVSFRYRLEITEHSIISATYTDNIMTVFLPNNEAQNWFNTPLEGFKTKQLLANDKFLTIIIQKDFPCLHQ